MFGESNIFSLAKEATNKTNEAIKGELAQINDVVTEVNKWSNEGNNSDEEIEEQTETILYFEKGENWLTDNQIYAYIWTDQGEIYNPYPGEPTTLVEGTENIYQYTVPKEYEGQNIIFNNGISSGVNQMQTVNLKMPTNGYIFRNTDASSRDIYFIEAWDEPVNIHMWNNGGSGTTWPGVLATCLRREEGYNVYTYTLPEEYDHFLFVRINDNGTPGQQTRDFAFTGGNKVYRSNSSSQPQEATIYSNGYWEKYEK